MLGWVSAQAALLWKERSQEYSGPAGNTVPTLLRAFRSVYGAERLHTSYLKQSKSHVGIVLALQQQYSVGRPMRR